MGAGRGVISTVKIVEKGASNESEAGNLNLDVRFFFVTGYRLTLPQKKGTLTAPSGTDVFRLSQTNYDSIIRAAQAGDCEAAFKLARHHAFVTLKFDEAVQWYRVAAKCPHVEAKGELVALLIDLPQYDHEVDKLLLEIAQLNPAAAEKDRRAVELVRENRKRPSNN